MESIFVGKIDECVLHGDDIMNRIIAQQLPFWGTIPADLPLKEITVNALPALLPRGAGQLGLFPKKVAVAQLFDS